MSELTGFAKVAPYLTHPLVLVGYVLMLFFGIHRALIKAGIIPPLSQRAGSKVVQMLLRYGFVIVILVIVLGFGVAFGRTTYGFVIAGLIIVLVFALEFRKVQKGPPMNVAEIVQTLVESHHKQLTAKDEQIEALTAAVNDLAAQRNRPDEPSGIEEALKQLSQGKLEAAENIFSGILARKVLEGEAANKESATAARHIGALAFLHDTQKALASYRQAVELDPDNPEGWNPLGYLLERVGDLSGAEAVYRKVLSLGESASDQVTVAAAYVNLGHVYQTRGELDQAEASYEKAVSINEALGHKEGMANAYGNLGNVYHARGELDRAEATYEKALAINEALGRKEGMANQYGSLGLVYQTRGELDRAETMYEKALAISEALGLKIGRATSYSNLGNVHYLRGELDQAEAMYEKALAINEALGHKEGMAISYSSLGNVYRTRGELDQVETMYRKSLEMFQQIGALDRAKKVQGLLDSLSQ